ncbi:MAG: hypothetical protein M1377_06700 [Deltaproteobacteria bacterium]|nr:hypothetical protein [Deltaproteobacteria bacterium]
MSPRYSFQGIHRDEFGAIVGSGTIEVWNIRTPTVATVYTAWSGGSAATSGQVVADANGRWQFFVSDSDYPIVSEFDIVMKKSGYSTQSYTAVR